MRLLFTNIGSLLKEAKAEGQAGQSGSVQAVYRSGAEAWRGRKRKGFRGSNADNREAEAEGQWEQLDLWGDLDDSE